MKTQTYFPLISENLSIDFINTEVIRWGNRHELLTDIQKFNDWLHIVSEYTPSLQWLIEHKTIELSDKDIKQLLLFRQFLRTLFLDIIHTKGNIKQTDIETMQTLANQLPYSMQLHKNAIVPIPNGSFYECIKSLIALDILQLISSNQLQYLRRCQNEACILLFLDKTGRRKWCSMKICGNRNKVTKHMQSKRQ